MNKQKFMSLVPVSATVRYYDANCMMCGENNATTRINQLDMGTLVSTQCHNEDCDYFEVQSFSNPDYMPNNRDK